MPPTLRRGVVGAVLERHADFVRLEVDGAPAVAFPGLTGAVEPGDEVLVNTQARELGLGSGGFDVVHANLTRGLGLLAPAGAHVMTLPYHPAQAAARFAEEDVELPASLQGLPVVCCGLHSQVAPVCAALAGRRVAYVQLPGGALPVSLSDTLRALSARGLVETTVAVSPCCDADLHCVTVAAGLAVAHALGHDAVVCGIGPGIVGTGTRLGHGGLAVADAANAAAALGGRAIVAPRVSLADPRERHRGLSHHTRAALDLCLGQIDVAWPRGLEPLDGLAVAEVDVADWQAACAGLPLDHMGRGADDDPWFFAAAFAAGRLAGEWT
jgi:hypothetical protein